jgi:hypothetical protein
VSELGEACFLLGANDAILWADRSSSAASLPDSHARWQAIWSNRHVLTEIAHSHPRGPLAFSIEDTTTMEAVDAALGRTLTYSVVTPDAMLRTAGRGPVVVESDEPWWTGLLRLASGLRPDKGSKRWPF